MMSTLIIFGVSFLGIVIVLGHKVWELKRGVSFLPQSIREKTDRLITETFAEQKDIFIKKSKKIIRTTGAATKRVAHGVALIAVHKVHDMTVSLLERLKGKGSRKNKGSASFFLRDMAEYKAQMAEEREEKKEGKQE